MFDVLMCLKVCVGTNYYHYHHHRAYHEWCDWRNRNGVVMKGRMKSQSLNWSKNTWPWDINLRFYFISVSVYSQFNFNHSWLISKEIFPFLLTLDEPLALAQLNYLNHLIHLAMNVCQTNDTLARLEYLLSMQNNW